MYPILRRFLETAGLRVYYEFRTMQGRPDVVGFELLPGNGNGVQHYARAIFIEAKVDDWKRALRQAHGHASYASEMYIAMPAEKAQRVDRSALERFGVGLLSVDQDDVTVRIPCPVRSLEDNWHRANFEKRLAHARSRSRSQCSDTGACIRGISSSAASSDKRSA